MKLNTKSRRFTRIEINLSNLSSNIRVLKSLLASPKTRMMAVVKSNAYGHGIIEVSKHAVKNGVGALGVVLAEDAIKLRKAGIKVPIYILGEPPLEIVKDAIKYDFILCLNSPHKAHQVSDICERFGKKISVHAKVDTGMNRVGINFRNAISEIEEISSFKGIKLDGVFTHFSCAGEPDQAYTEMQWGRFLDVLDKLREKNIIIPVVHCANSAAFFRNPGYHLDMVRLGISIYGCSPFGSGADSWLESGIIQNLNKLRPVLCLKSRVSFVKNVPPGESVSYGAAFKTARDSIIATVPIGYADGYSRLLSNKASVLINGCFAPLAGNVTMDQIMVDATDVADKENIREGTEVVLVGSCQNSSASSEGSGTGTDSVQLKNTGINFQTKNACKISADYLANLMGTINYEVLTMLKDRIPRVYIY